MSSDYWNDQFAYKYREISNVSMELLERNLMNQIAQHPQDLFDDIIETNTQF